MPVDRRTSLAEAIHLWALGFWLGVLLLIGLGAPLVFLTLRDLEPTLASYTQFSGPHYRIAGGHIVRKLFAICDVVQIACMVLAAITLGLARPALGRPLRLGRAVVLAIIAGILLYRFAWLNSGLTAALDGYWAAARAGDDATAQSLRQTYEQGHQLENRLFAATAFLVLVQSFLALVAARRRPAP